MGTDSFKFSGFNKINFSSQKRNKRVNSQILAYIICYSESQILYVTQGHVVTHLQFYQKYFLPIFQSFIQISENLTRLKQTYC